MKDPRQLICGHCSYLLDGHICADPTHTKPPGEGDVCVCIDCEKLNLMKGDKLIPIEETDLKDWPQYAILDLKRAQRALREVNKKNRESQVMQ